jgi:hypothetical protein
MSPITVSSILAIIRNRDVTEETDKKWIRTALRDMGYTATPQNFYVLGQVPQKAGAVSQQAGAVPPHDEAASASGLSEKTDQLLEFFPDLRRQEAVEILRKCRFDVNSAATLLLDTPIVVDDSEPEILDQIIVRINVEKKKISVNPRRV